MLKTTMSFQVFIINKRLIVNEIDAIKNDSKLTKKFVEPKIRILFKTRRLFKSKKSFQS